MTTKAEREKILDIRGKVIEATALTPKVVIYENGRAKGDVRGHLRAILKELDLLLGEDGDGNV